MATASSLEMPFREPSPPFLRRNGSNPIERKALYRAQLDIAAMPASLVVQIALWPDKIADWCKEESIHPPVAYNCLAGVKPYHDVRDRLANRLGVSRAWLDQLIDAPRPQPSAKRPPDPPAEFRGPFPGPPEEPTPPAGPAPSPPITPHPTPHTRHRREPAGIGAGGSQIAFNL